MAMKRHERLIRRAIDVALTSEYRWQHGAVVAKGNKFLGSAPNKFRNHPEIAPNDVSDHAERAVIRELLKTRDDLRGCTIYIARISKEGRTAISRPCTWCMWAIIAAGVKEVVYTNDLGGYSVENVRHLDNR